MITIHNTTTGEITEREATADELKQQKADQAEAQEQLKAQTLKATKKAALLARLGITEDEAKSLLL